MIKATVPLKLSKQHFECILEYDTYTNITFDKYIIASLLKNEPNESGAYKYIDDISGKGSLNQHFKNIYQEMKYFNQDQLNKIIDNSLYPLRIITKTHFEYIEMLNISIFNKKIYDGNLKDKNELLKDVLLPKSNDVTFASLQVNEIKNKEENTDLSDNYDVEFYDHEIKVILDNHKAYSISKEDFDKIHLKNSIDIQKYIGDIHFHINNNENWYGLSQSFLDNLKNDKFSYKDINGNYAVINENYIKVTEIISIFNMYFYNESKYEFSEKNHKIIKNALNEILNNKWFNEMKVKNLIKILNLTNNKICQDIIVDFFKVKDSKELAEFAIKIIKKGFYENWPKETCFDIKRNIQNDDYKYLYKVNPDLDWTDEELLYVNKDVLTQYDKDRRNKFISDKGEMINLIMKWQGQIESYREKSKKLKNNPIVKKFHKKTNEISHSKMTEDDLNKLSYDEVKEIFEKLHEFYNGTFQDFLHIFRQKS